MKFTLGPVMLGQPVPFRGEELSAIAKQPTSGPVAVGMLGLEGDQVADLVHHGGVDKAIHHYPHDHYATWQEELDGHELLEAPGGFGENISTTGLVETELRIGDRLRLGTALVEVSQGRQPCWKVDHRFQRKGVMARIVRTGRSGWYYRVLEPGEVAAGDMLEMVERGPAEWPVERVFRILIAGGHKHEPEALTVLADLPQLAIDWRERAKRLSSA
jgi:MOSC domain-containing protein YiiM